MSKLPKSFKRKDHGTMQNFKAIPAGDYKAKIVDSDYKKTASKNGHYLMLVLEIQDKEFKGSKVWANLNLDNENETAVQIANDEFATILDACGKKTVKDSEELHGILMNVTVGIKEEKNVIKMYEAISGGSDEDEDEDEDEPEEKNDSSSDSKAVEKLAKKFKKLTDAKALKKVLKEYDISKASEIADLDEDDLESLQEDLEDEIEDAED